MTHSVEKMYFLWRYQRLYTWLLVYTAFKQLDVPDHFKHHSDSDFCVFLCFTIYHVSNCREHDIILYWLEEFRPKCISVFLHVVSILGIAIIHVHSKLSLNVDTVCALLSIYTKNDVTSVSFVYWHGCQSCVHVLLLVYNCHVYYCHVYRCQLSVVLSTM